MDQKIQWALSEMLKALSPDFHGAITFHFASGKLTTYEARETKKPPVDLKTHLK